MDVCWRKKKSIEHPSGLTLPLVSSDIRSKKKRYSIFPVRQQEHVEKCYVMYGTVPDSVERENFGGNWVVVKGIFSALSHQSGRSLGARGLVQ